MVWRRLLTCDRCEKRERQSGYRSVSFSAFSQFTDRLLLHIRLTLRRRGITVPRNSLARCNARHLRIKRLVQFIFADPIYHNALTNCAALSCRALRRVARMCSRTVSGTAYRFRHGSTLCSPTVEKILCRSPFRSGHMSAIFARLRNKGNRELRG